MMAKRAGKQRRSVINTARVSVISLGAAFVIFGIYRGECVEILGKAVRICLECIGIG